MFQDIWRYLQGDPSYSRISLRTSLILQDMWRYSMLFKDILKDITNFEDIQRCWRISLRISWIFKENGWYLKTSLRTFLIFQDLSGCPFKDIIKNITNVFGYVVVCNHILKNLLKKTLNILIIFKDIPLDILNIWGYVNVSIRISLIFADM